MITNFDPTVNSISDLSNINTDIEADIFSEKIINENGFYEDVARFLLRYIIEYCVRENISDFCKLQELVNSDIDTIISSLSKYSDIKDEDIKTKIIKNIASENAIAVMRLFVNKFEV